MQRLQQLPQRVEWVAALRSRTGIVSRMDMPDAAHDEIVALSEQLDRLLEHVRRLNEENRSLRQSQEQLTGERAGLMERNEQARSRVETMIQRLKSLENNG